MFNVAQRDHETRYEYGEEWLRVVRMMWESEKTFDFKAGSSRWAVWNPSRSRTATNRR